MELQRPTAQNLDLDQGIEGEKTTLPEVGTTGGAGRVVEKEAAIEIEEIETEETEESGENEEKETEEKEEIETAEESAAETGSGKEKETAA